MSEVVNEASETETNPVVENVDAKVAEVAKPAKAKKKPAKEPEPVVEAVESKEPSQRKSIYWPSVRSFLGSEVVSEAVKSACDRLGVVEPKECESIDASFGSMRDVVESLAMLDKSNVEEDDMDGLAECLFAMAK